MRISDGSADVCSSDLIGIATRRTARIMASSPSITNLGRAPHRLMFFVGGLNLLLAMAWRAAWLISARWGLLSMPQPEPYAGRLHADRKRVGEGKSVSVRVELRGGRISKNKNHN